VIRKLAFLLALSPILAVSTFAAAPQESARIQQSADENVPRLVQFSGTLTPKDSAARPVSGAASVTFAIYAQQDGGTALWSETQNVLADANGHYSVVLGAASASGVPATLFGTGESRWLGVTIARQPEMPRLLLASVPYALKAQDAETLGGLPASSYVTTQQLTASHAVAAPATTILATPQSTNTVASNQSAANVGADAASQSVTQATVSGTGTAQFLPLWTSASNLGNSKIFQSAGGFIGINTTTPLLQLDVNGNSIFRGSFQMAPQGTATAATGQPSHSFQWQASVFNSFTNSPQNVAFGFRTVPFNNDTSGPGATLDLFFGQGGGVLNDTGLSIDSHGVITFVPGQTFGFQTTSFSAINLTGSGANAGQLLMGGQPFLSTDQSTSSIYLGIGAGTASINGATAGDNVGIGFLSLASATTAGQNTAVGINSLTSLQDGILNTAIGDRALAGDLHGNQNFAGGYSALAGSTGVGNTGVGSAAGQGDTSGSYNSFLGFDAGVGSPNLSNSTAIGAFATVNENDAIVLGNAGLINGITPPPHVGIATATPISALEISSPLVSSTSVPAPILTLSNSSPGTVNSVAIDFDPTTSSSGLPFARIAATGQTSGANLDFYTHQGSIAGGSLLHTMMIDNTGAVTIFGSLHVNGEIIKGSGTFKIDDPIDPANKYLSHSFVESPDMMNIYNGNITTDASGLAIVEMPAWFEALNQDFRYQLTVMGQFAQAIVGSEIAGNKFTIRTDKPNVKVSWQVTGIRHDAYALTHPTPVEEAKPASEQGHYLHPEAFGLGQDKAVSNVFAAAPVAPVQSASSSAASTTTGSSR
jgi:trimeric autotransporter adhesin